MPKFKVGDRVRIVRGYDEGAEGIVTNPYWQIAANDWPLVLFTDSEGNRHSADDSNMDLIEDPDYEYAIQRTIVGGPGAPMIVGEFWSILDEVNMGLLNLSTDRTNYKLVKRRRAGEIEDV